MIQRDIQSSFLQLMTQYPVITLTGPRQSGKTTFVKENCGGKPYFNLEEPDTRQRILADPRTFFSQHEDGAVLDEIQRAPELLSYIQSIVDEKKIPGMFILTGSNQFQLNESITQSLAGRTALLELLPLSINELQQVPVDLTQDEYLLNGFYPALYDKQLQPNTLYKNYIQTYLERDIKQLIHVRDLTSFQNFIRLTAGRIGSTLNTESLANDIGVSHNTIKHWLSILETSYLLYRLKPYFENFGKRILKSPKIYFTDIGIASYLLGIETPVQISRDPLRGGLFENLVLLEIIKTRLNAGKEPRLYYYRDSNQNEVDILYKQANYLIPIEIKSTSTFNVSLLKNLQFFQRTVGDRMPIGFLVYAGEEYRVKDFHLINYKNTASIPRLIDELT